VYDETRLFFFVMPADMNGLESAAEAVAADGGDHELAHVFEAVSVSRTGCMAGISGSAGSATITRPSPWLGSHSHGGAGFVSALQRAQEVQDVLLLLLVELVEVVDDRVRL